MKNTNNKLLENSREKIDILLSFGASEELDTSLDKLITFQIAKYNNNINQMRYELERFETKYQMASEECKSRLLSVKIAMAIWFQVSEFRVSGVRCQVSIPLFIIPDT